MLLSNLALLLVTLLDDLPRLFQPCFAILAAGDLLGNAQPVIQRGAVSFFGLALQLLNFQGQLLDELGGSRLRHRLRRATSAAATHDRY